MNNTKLSNVCFNIKNEYTFFIKRAATKCYNINHIHDAKGKEKEWGAGEVTVGIQTRNLAKSIRNYELRGFSFCLKHFKYVKWNRNTALRDV